jgi:hypothetical protein
LNFTDEIPPLEKELMTHSEEIANGRQIPFWNWKQKGHAYERRAASHQQERAANGGEKSCSCTHLTQLMAI